MASTAPTAAPAGRTPVPQAAPAAIVGRDDAIYVYGPRGKAASYAYECTKKLVVVHKDYVLVVSPPKGNFAGNTMLRQFGGQQVDGLMNSSNLTILDADLKLIAYSDKVNGEVN